MSFKTHVFAGILAFGLISGKASAAAHDNDVEWDGIFSDTTANFVSPLEFDAGDTITLGLRAKAGDLTAVTCRLWFSGPDREQRLPMSLTGTDGLFDTWTVAFTVPVTTSHVYYRFEVIDGTDTDYYDAGAPGDLWNVRGMSDDYRGEDYNFHLVPGLRTPDWSKNAVFYQIFPDRFYNGDPTNDSLFPDDCFWYLDYSPALPDAPQCQAYSVPPAPDGWSKSCEVHENWDDTPNGGPCDFFGGDLAGIAAKLDYISSLGATAIYLNPVFRSLSNHKYDTMDYTQVDPRFGSNALLASLVDAAAGRGIRLILDGVFNHTSDVSKYYNQWMNYALDGDTASGYDPYPDDCGAWEEVFLNSVAGNWTDCTGPYTDWFKIWVGVDAWDVDRDGDTTEPAAHNCGWAGFEFMPDIDYKSPTQPDSSPRVWLYGGSSAANPLAAAQSIAGMWLADGALLPSGLDGWRLDVPDNAGYFTNAVPSDCSKEANDLSIWQGFRTAVDAVGNDKYVVGELWQDASSNLGKDYTAGVFDGVMNYHYFAMPVSCFVTGTGVHNDVSECSGVYGTMTPGSVTSVASFESHLATERRVYPAPFYLSSQNLISSHDTARFVSRAEGDLEKLKEAFLLQATLPGAPMIYYGDELAVDGPNNELGRAPFPWTLLDDSSAPEVELKTYAAQLMCVRNTYGALRTGSVLTVSLSNTQKTWGFARFDGQDQVVVALNNDGTAHSVTLDVWRAGIADGVVLVDLFSGLEYVVGGGAITVQVARNAGVILVPRSRAGLADGCFGGGVDNNPPVADAGDDVRARTGETVVLDGSGSSDPDGDPLSFEWRDREGNVLGTDKVVTVGPFDTAGTYTFTLTVSDGEYSDQDVVKVTVDDGPGCSEPGTGPGLTGATGAVLPFVMGGLMMAAIRRRRRRTSCL